MLLLLISIYRSCFILESYIVHIISTFFSSLSILYSLKCLNRWYRHVLFIGSSFTFVCSFLFLYQNDILILFISSISMILSFNEPHLILASNSWIPNLFRMSCPAKKSLEISSKFYMYQNLNIFLSSSQHQENLKTWFGANY